MVFSLARAAAFFAIVTPLVSSLSFPTEDLKPRALRNSPHRRDGDPTGGGCSNGPQSRGCWKGDFCIDTDMDEKWPNTGKVVKYNLEITNTTMSPDGFERLVLALNGQFPGPTLVAGWGDILEITVSSKLTANGTGLHWHGLRQLHSNEMDGVNGLTECPLAPGETKTYRFQCTQYGTTWYHSHYSVQYADGVWGTMIINGPATANYDVELGVLPFTDWFHAPTSTVNAATLHANGPPIADNMLVNGSMTSRYGGKYAVTTLTPGKSHLLRLVNVGINNWVHVGLDGHNFTAVAADLVPIVPYEASSLSIAVGQRYDVIINATQSTSSYWLRAGTGGGACDGPNANAANIRSIFRYAGAPSGVPSSSANIRLPTGCYDEQVTSYVKIQVPRDVPKNMTVGFTNTAGSGNLVQWFVDGSPMQVNLDYPTLQQVVDGNKTFAQDQHAFEVGEKGKFQYWVIQQDQRAPAVPHPVHLHGHDFYVLDLASGPWTGDTSKLITNNPIRRDTATLPASGYLVLAFESDNPGVWLFHCHIPYHVASGLGVQFIERLDEIAGSIGSLSANQRECKSWTQFTSTYHGYEPDGSLLIDGNDGFVSLGLKWLVFLSC